MKALEEKIIDILDKDKNLECKYDFTQEKEEDCLMNLCSNTAKAKEIASMMKEFMEWVDTEGYRFHSRHNIWCYENRIGVVRKTIDELFDYWLNNIKK